MQKESARDASEHGEDHGRSTNETETVAFTTIRRVNKTYKSKDKVDKAMRVCRE